MNIIDALLSKGIKYLQKKQKERARNKKKKKAVKKKIKAVVVKRVVKKKNQKKLAGRREPPKKKVVKKKTGKILAQKEKSKKKAPAVKIAKVKEGSKGILVGEITHFFSKIQVVVIKVKRGDISAGDQIHIKGKQTDFIQKIDSLQIESVDVKKAKKGQLAGLKVKKPAREGDQVFKL